MPGEVGFPGNRGLKGQKGTRGDRVGVRFHFFLANFKYCLQVEEGIACRLKTHDATLLKSSRVVCLKILDMLKQSKILNESSTHATFPGFSVASLKFFLHTRMLLLQEDYVGRFHSKVDQTC